MTDYDSQRRLARVQVVNWGTFDGYHQFEVSRLGFLITGNSGSGKSTLLDAISAVLMPGDRVKFNAAAQETERSGRTLISYIRGAWRRDTDSESDVLVSSYLRPGATMSAIGLTYRTDDDQPSITLVKAMHLGRGKNTVADVSHLHMLIDDEFGLTDLIPYLASGIDTRNIRKQWPTADVNPSYAPFARRFRTRLGISSEGAQRLLHRTLSAKSLGSLDQLFRDFMLDVPTTFDLANRAVDQFQDLQEAHRVVVDAREQVEMLGPLPDLASTRAASSAVVAATDEERQYVDAVYTRRVAEILERELAELEARTPLIRAAAESAQREADVASEAFMDARIAVDGAGGGRIAALTATLNQHLATLERTRTRRARIALAVQAWDGDVPATAEDFARLTGEVNSLLAEQAVGHEDRNKQKYTLSDQRGEARRERSRLEADREALARRRSNIDPPLLLAREMLCAATSLTEQQLPFAGELVEVLSSESDWTGPIERVLGGFARTLLVPDDLYRSVAAAVDSHHLGTRLVYRRIRPTHTTPKRTSRASLVRKVRVSDGPFRHWMNEHLSSSYDYVCVDTVAELADQARGVTRAGQVKHSAERHEKDDRRRVDDRSRWVLGFDNEAKIADLRRRITRLDDQIKGWTAQLESIDSSEQQRMAQLRAAQTLLDADWVDIDVESAEKLCDDTTAMITRWRKEHPEHSVLTDQLAAAEKLNASASEAKTAAQTDLSKHLDQVSRTQRRIAAGEAAESVPDAVESRLNARFTQAFRRLTSDNIDRARTTVDRAIDDENRKAHAELSTATTAITKVLTRYLARWEARGSEMQADASYVDDALAVLTRLRSEGLPRYEDRFFELLNDQSSRNLSEMAHAIRKAPAAIRARIDPVNASLRDSPFDTDRWLRITVKESRTAVATEFLDELSALTGGAWADEGRQDAEQRFTRMSSLLNRLGSTEPADQSWRRRVLDTRQHVRFIGVEVDVTGEPQNYHDSSAGLSGGQAQKLVFFCLAAALRYQLAPDGEGVPTYGTVILDEAFDRADAAYTRRALDVFTQFGFHLVLATPLKLLQTLEEYIGGTATVGIKDNKQSTIDLIDWVDA